MDELDPQRYALDRIRNISREFVWSPSCNDNWKADLRRRLRESTGLPQTRESKLEPLILESREFFNCRCETITFSSREGLRVLSHLMVPFGMEEPAPAVICVPGHGKGVASLVGDEPSDYQHQFALQCVAAGYVTLAIEPISFGHRKATIEANKESSCFRDSMAALMLGESMIGWRTHDALAAVDFLLTRQEVDASRIATMGISGGGLVAFWAACFDERIQAAVVSGYFNTFFDSILSIEHCADNFSPGLAKVVEMPDMAALIAPRRLFAESGRDDQIFPVRAFRRACERARQIYVSESVADHFACDEFEAGHEFSGRKAFPKLAKWFATRL